MAADSRSTHTDALATLGTIINDNEKRDAIHLGVEPVEAGETLRAGDHIGLHRAANGRMYALKASKSNSKKPFAVKAIGIVDPFLKEMVNVGDWFWLIVYPRQITSLRHVWEHPDFPDSRETGYVQPEVSEEKKHQMLLLIGEPKAVAKERMQKFCDELDIELEQLMAHAHARTVDDCHYWNAGEKFEGETLYNEFWDDFKILSDQPNMNTSSMGEFFTCSC